FKFPTFAAFTQVSAKGRGGVLRPLGLLKDGNLCVQICESDASGHRCRFETFDGLTFEPLPEAPPADGNFSILFTAQNGDFWLGGDQGTAWRHDHKWKTFVTSDKSAPESALAFAEMTDGKI